jgi:hypothetical protein
MVKDSKEYKIPEGGSLGLLALGDIGLIKWREKRAEMKLKKKSTKKKKKNG